MAFKVAMSNNDDTTTNPLSAISGAPIGPPEWANTTGVPDDGAATDTAFQIKRIAADGNTADEDYFVFIPSSSGLLTVQAINDATDARDSDTSGTFFGAMGTGPDGEMWTGEIATDTDSGPGNHFKFTVPVQSGENYLIKVEGTDGAYRLEYSFLLGAGGPFTPPAAPISGTVVASTEQQQNRYLYLLNIEESGTLYLHTTGRTDVVGTLYGPDGSEIAMDDNSGDSDNFRIATNVGTGVYILEVKGIDRDEAGRYDLVSNFVVGAGPDPEPPTTTPPTTPVTPTTDANGRLENPPADSVRSGIGIIDGWVCQAGILTVTITPVDDGTTLEPFTIGYGGDRPDTVGQCGGHSRPNTGFGMAFNFNRLAEGKIPDLRQCGPTGNGLVRPAFLRSSISCPLKPTMSIDFWRTCQMASAPWTISPLRETQPPWSGKRASRTSRLPTCGNLFGGPARSSQRDACPFPSGIKQGRLRTQPALLRPPR